MVQRCIEEHLEVRPEVKSPLKLQVALNLVTIILRVVQGIVTYIASSLKGRSSQTSQWSLLPNNCVQHDKCASMTFTFFDKKKQDTRPSYNKDSVDPLYYFFN